MIFNSQQRKDPSRANLAVLAEYPEMKSSNRSSLFVLYPKLASV